MSSAAGHACDACRRRKIRCDRSQPCSCCQSASLSCTFLAPTRAKGRQGRTANIISQLRSSQIQNIQGSISQSRTGVRSQDLLRASTSRTEGLLTLETFNACREFYFSQFHASVPILEEGVLRIDEERGLTDVSNDLYCLVVSFCAFIILQTGAVHPKSSSATGTNGGLLEEDIGYGQRLIRECVGARRNSKPIVQPSVQTVVTSFLLYACYRFLNDESKAWFFLREATTLYISGMLDDEVNGDLKGSSSSTQLFWLLLLTERAYAIRKHRPLTLLVSSSSPPITSLTPSLINSAFTHLVKLYQPFDEIFLGSWNETSSATTVESLLALETHLQKTISVDMNLSEIQLADLLVSQQWLRMIVWQLATKLGFLSSTSKHESLTFRYPVTIARDLTISTWATSLQSMEIHGIGLVEKLFDICYQLIDVIAYTSSSTLVTQEQTELSPQDYLSHLFSLIARLRGAEDRFLPLLQVKLDQTLPGLVNPLLRSPNSRMWEVLGLEGSPRSEDDWDVG